MALEEKQFDRLLSELLDIKQDVVEVKERLTHVEETQEMTYRRIDGFLNLVDRHEAEISALRVGLERVEQRLAVLEAKRA